MNVQDIPRGGDDYASVALIDAATALLAKRNRDIPEDFLAKLFGLAVPEDLERYGADELAAIAERSWSFLAERSPGVPKLRFEPAAAPRGIAVLEIVNDDMPFLVDSVVGELNQRGLDIRLFVHPVFVVERDSAGRLITFKGARTTGGQRESFIHLHIEGMEDAAQRAEIVAALESILADVRVCVQDWQAMLARVRGVIAELRTGPPPLAVEEIAEAIQFLEWMADDNFTLLGRARLYVRRQRGCARTGIRNRPRPASFARHAAVTALERTADHHCGSPRLLERAQAPHCHQVDGALARAPARPSRLHRRQALRPFRQARRRTPLLRSVHLDRLYPAGAHHSLSAAQDRQHHPPRRFRSVEPFRQGVGQCARKLSARRTVPDRRRYALSVRAGHSPARRASARARAAAARPLRPLRVGPRLRSARPLQRSNQGGDRQLSGRGLQGTLERLLPVFPGRAAGARPFHHRTFRRRYAESGPRRARARGRSDRAQLDRRAARGAPCRSRPGTRAHTVRALSRSLPDRLPRGLPATDGACRHRRHRGAFSGASARRRTLPRRRRRPAERGTESVQPQSADSALRTRAGVGEHGLPRRRRAHLPHRSEGHRGSLVPRHDA